ncbi:hypothetical protein C8T65DRAFT_635381 [Cerioporus squamosus]|nr:hypothetical protein C8T65DRAFT_635381 [Cerioporus squamosus]
MTVPRLPPELVIAVLVHLEYRTLLHCRQVCRLYKEIIDSDIPMQYIVELGAAGMEDGPPSDLTPSARLALLRERQSAWGRLTWRSELSIPMQLGPWELYGGVLAQKQGGRKLVFQQLPSAIRGIKAKEWELSDVGTDILDFSMDPAQDLLVVAESRELGDATLCCLHLKSLQTGASHPAALESAVLMHRTLLGAFTPFIQIAGDYLGILLSDVFRDPSELLVWNWQTGESKLHVLGLDFSSFTFLTPRHLLLAPFGNNPTVHDGMLYDAPRKPRILVVDLDLVSHEPVQLNDLEYICEFLYPELQPACHVRGTTIRSDPSPHWRPHPSLQVPFSVARDERLFVVALRLVQRRQHHTLLSFIPSSTLYAFLSSIPIGKTRHTFTWADWGPQGSRFYVTPVTAVWICYVYGMSFVFLSRNGSRQVVNVLDFNQCYIRRARTDPDREPASQNALLVTKATMLAKGELFEGRVQTSLPYRETETMNFDQEREGRIDAAMIDEDSLILVSSLTQPEGFRVLTF